jgi:hypothetical protein
VRTDVATQAAMDAKTSKSPPPSAGLAPKKEFLFLFLPRLIYCFQKQKKNKNANKIKEF